MKDEELKSVLEALKRMKRFGNTFGYRSHEQNPYEQVCEAVAVCEQALAAPVPVPDWKDGVMEQQAETILWQAKRIAELLDQQAAQPAPVPLTDKQSAEMWLQVTLEPCTHEAAYLRGIKDAEAAHGIKENT